VKLLGRQRRTFAVVVGLRQVGETAKRSETTLVIAIHGHADLYTVQWPTWSPADKAECRQRQMDERLLKRARCASAPSCPARPPLSSCVGT